MDDEYIVDYKGNSEIYDEDGDCYDSDKKSLQIGSDLMVYDVNTN